MLISSSTKHKSEFQFEAILEGTSIQFDVPLSMGGQGNGVSPKFILLNALSACSGMDVVAILNKMNIIYSNFEIKAEGELTEEHPKYFKKINLTFELVTAEINFEKVEKAVKLSLEKYCGVNAMLSKAAKINYRIVIKM